MQHNVPTHKIKAKPKRPPKTLARKRHERQELRHFLHQNKDTFGPVKTTIKRVQRSLEDWAALPTDQEGAPHES